MKYIEFVKKLQNKDTNKGHIVIIKSGIFFIGIGKDAIILNELFGLKLICMKENLCKVGFQTRSIEKYISKLQQENKSFVIYDYNNENKTEEEIIRFEGEPIFEENECLDCKKCENRKETTQEIIERIKQNAIK